MARSNGNGKRSALRRAIHLLVGVALCSGGPAVGEPQGAVESLEAPARAEGVGPPPGRDPGAPGRAESIARLGLRPEQAAKIQTLVLESFAEGEAVDLLVRFDPEEVDGPGRTAAAARRKIWTCSAACAPASSPRARACCGRRSTWRRAT